MSARIVLCAMALSACIGAAENRSVEGRDSGVAIAERNAPSKGRFAASSSGKPYVERIEQVADDGTVWSPAANPIDNVWGGHQPRITRHVDGSVRLVYLRTDSHGEPAWRLMKRGPKPADPWVEEASGETTGEVALLRDAPTDAAYVIAWPRSVPHVHASPGFEGRRIPGKWQVLSSRERHYANAGIGADGMLCVKAHFDQNIGGTYTLDTEVHYVCGKRRRGAWSWQPQVRQFIGQRHAYDYILPGAFGDAASFAAVSVRDVDKQVAGLPKLGANYVFDGLRQYSTRTETASGWKQSEIVEPRSVDADATHAANMALQDVFADSKRRLFTQHLLIDPDNPPARGHYLTVTDAGGAVLYQERWSGLPTGGNTRIFEDADRRLWLLWTGTSGGRIEAALYRIEERSPSRFSLGPGTELSSAFAGFDRIGFARIAVPRGGQPVLDAVDGFFAAGTTSSGQRIAYFRIRLPK